MTKGEKAKSELKTPELVTNHPVGDKKGLIIGCLDCQVIYQGGATTIAEDSQMQGRWPGPLYELQEAVRSGDKWPV